MSRERIEEVSRFKTSDGKLFVDYDDAAKHEEQLDSFAAIEAHLEAHLGKRPDSCEFSNGGGYIQHARETIAIVRGLLARSTNGASGRMLDDSGSVFYALWVRLECIDDHCREWGQPYYARNWRTLPEIKVKEWAGK